MDIPISLAGNFGELRPGHFHAGLDIRTQGKEGIPVVAVADGIISRVGISLYGYGKVIYIDHPNGYTSVYAHLMQFGKGIEDWVKDVQYSQKRFVLDTALSEGFSVTQGQTIGFSGNTGGSVGPHLHFEIRNTQTESPINPLYFYKNEIVDNIKPSISQVSIYPLNGQSSVNGQNNPIHIKAIKVGDHYFIASSDIPTINGKIGFGIEVKDHLNGSHFRNGVYSVELFKNGRKVYSHKLDSFSFNHTRCINSHMDFCESVKTKRKIQKSFVMGGNQLNIYQDLVNNGQLFFSADTLINMEYIITDFHGNSSRFIFNVTSSSKSNPTNQATNFAKELIYGEENSFENENVRIKWPSTCLYDNLKFEFGQDEAIGRCQTPRYLIQNRFEPLNDYMELSININHLPQELQSKCVIMSLTEKAQVIAAEGGEIENGWITCKTRSFGPYTVFLDTIAPKIKPVDFYAGKDVRNQSRLTFYLSDDISGVETYEASVNGKWTLVEYERNKRKGFIQLEDVKPISGKQVLEIKLVDGVGNVTTEKYSLQF